MDEPMLIRVRCERDKTVFDAVPVLGWSHDFVIDKPVKRLTITCPTCNRRYVQDDDGRYQCDRPLTILS
jgi:hypothetical protein